MLTLRPYQTEARDAVIAEWDKGHRKTLLVLPTGTGKTVVFSSIIGHRVARGGKALVLAHRGELLTQAADKLLSVTGLPCGLEKAESTTLNGQEVITVGSVQTMSQENRLRQFPQDYFTDIVDLNERDVNGKPIFTAEKVMKEVGMLNKVHEELITLENRVKKELAEKSTLRAGAIEDFDPGDF
jgi:ABC-type branched-subunit amino acid transport system ATPase component